MIRKVQPSRGEVWLADLDPTRGREQHGRRPVLILSATAFNHGPAGLVVVIPITSRDKGIALHVRVTPPQGGLQTESFIKTEDLRSISVERLGRRLGTVSPQTLAEVDDAVRILLEL